MKFIKIVYKKTQILDISKFKKKKNSTHYVAQLEYQWATNSKTNVLVLVDKKGKKKIEVEFEL